MLYLATLDSPAPASASAAIDHYTRAKTRHLADHRCFRALRAGSVDRAQLLEIIKRLYCFSVFFERVITRRVANYSSLQDPAIIRIARAHLREEIGHADLFRACLLENGLSAAEVAALKPGTFTKAMFGYLVATVDYEDEYSTNILIMQVMEAIGHEFFATMLGVMKAHGLNVTAFAIHAEEDEEHSRLGLDLYDHLGPSRLEDARRIINGAFALMELVFDEWMDAAPKHQEKVG